MYGICLRLGGIDVNVALGAKSPYPEQQEIVVPGGILGGQVNVAISKAINTTARNKNCDCD